MNLILLEEADFVTDDRVRLGGRRLRHLRDVLHGAVGDRIVVGRLGGRLGRGTVVEIGDEGAELELALDRDPPPALPVTLVLALPRPPVLRRLLAAITAMGVKRLILLNTARTEKSYWQSSVLGDESIARHLRLGLEQARDTVPPTVEMRRRFRSFAEDELPSMLRSSLGLFAQPGSGSPCPRSAGQPVTLVVGPEGGLVDFEIERLEAAGARAVTLGPRALRVETAVVALLALLAS